MARNPDFPRTYATAVSKQKIRLQVIGDAADDYSAAGAARNLCEKCPARRPRELHVATNGQKGADSIGKVRCTGIEPDGKGRMQAKRERGSSSEALDEVTSRATPCGAEPFGLVEGYEPPHIATFGKRKPFEI